MTKILVTGATGTIGRQIVDQLLDAGAAVKVAVRNPNKASAFAERGAEVVAYDIENDVGVSEAFGGVDRAFLLTPFVPDFETLTRRAVQAAKEAGVRHMVKLSAAGADSASASWLARSHGLGDEAVEASGIAYTILQPTFFQENILNFSAQSIESEGTFYGASSNQPVVYVSGRDIAAVASRVLLQPESHHQKTYSLTGAAGVTGEQLARLLTEATGRSVTYTDVSAEQYGEALRANGTPQPFVEAFVGLEHVKAQGWAAEVSPHIFDVLGRPPESYANFLARHKERLPLAPAVAPSR